MIVCCALCYKLSVIGFINTKVVVTIMALRPGLQGPYHCPLNKRLTTCVCAACDTLASTRVSQAVGSALD
jgi:hypothetical protein